MNTMKMTTADSGRYGGGGGSFDPRDVRGGGGGGGGGGGRDYGGGYGGRDSRGNTSTTHPINTPSQYIP